MSLETVVANGVTGIIPSGISQCLETFMFVTLRGFYWHLDGRCPGSYFMYIKTVALNPKVLSCPESQMCQSWGTLT